MDFRFVILSIVFASGFVGTAFAQIAYEDYGKEFTQEEIDAMKQKAVLITTNSGTMIIEMYPEYAPGTVHNFLELVESGYYDGIVFHRIIPGFMIQGGDPNTKDTQVDRQAWGRGGPGYSIQAEFNTMQHDRGIVSMARGHIPDSAGSQFFIMHKDSPRLDGQYTAFGRLVPGTHSFSGLEAIASLETDNRDAPIDVHAATIVSAKILDPFSAAGFGEPELNQSILKEKKVKGGITKVYQSDVFGVNFDLPYRWTITAEATGNHVNLVLEPTQLEHNVQLQIEESGFVPQVLVTSEERRSWEVEGNKVSSGTFSIKGGDEPKISANYIFQTEDGMRAHILTTTQNVQTPTEMVQFKVLQLHFNNLDTNYSIIYVGLTEWFKYEVNAFTQVVSNFEIEIDGQKQPVNFADNPVFKQVVEDAAFTEADPTSLPPARIGGCLIATASYGSELAPQVQLLREIRDNTVLQTQSGTSFMTAFNHFYYSFSPTIADYERENSVFKEAVKLTLTPLLASLTLLQYADIDSEHEMLGYGIGLILLNVGMYFIAPAILITKIRSFYKLQ